MGCHPSHRRARQTFTQIQDSVGCTLERPRCRFEALEAQSTTGIGGAKCPKGLAGMARDGAG